MKKVFPCADDVILVLLRDQFQACQPTVTGMGWSTATTSPTCTGWAPITAETPPFATLNSTRDSLPVGRWSRTHPGRSRTSPRW